MYCRNLVVADYHAAVDSDRLSIDVAASHAGEHHRYTGYLTRPAVSTDGGRRELPRQRLGILDHLTGHVGADQSG